jgi:hypothetical protein
MIFRRPKPALPELTNEAYGRWLRAHRPPLELFLGLSSLEQEALATIGDNYATDQTMALAYALNPALTQEGAQQPATQDQEGSLAVKLAEGLIARMSGNKPAQPAPEPFVMPKETFSGFGERRKEEHIEPAKPTLFGKQPDAVTT